MRYIEFRDKIKNELHGNPAGLTWTELKQRLNLPYDHPCPTWVKQMEQEVGLSRKAGTGRAKIWRVNPEKQTTRGYPPK